MPPCVFPKEQEYKRIFASDGAYEYVKQTGIRVDVVSGDWDSAKTIDFPDNIEIIFTPDQNFTDFEKALQIIYKQGFKNVDVWGCSGKEQDHFLGNLSTGLKYSEKLSLRFYDEYHCYFFAEPSTTLKGCKGKRISLYPFPEAREISTKGLKYGLDNETLSISNRIGIRNQAIEDQVKISYKSGSLILFVER